MAYEMKLKYTPNVCILLAKHIKHTDTVMSYGMFLNFEMKDAELALLKPKSLTLCLQNDMS